MVSRIDAELGPFPEAHLEAMRDVDRAAFVRPEDASRAELDTPLPLDGPEVATISAPHAYLLSYRLLDLAAGDRLLELGSGSGYGAALASEIVGSTGRVVTVEIDRELAARAQVLLAPRKNVRVIAGDAQGAGALIPEANKIVCAFAVSSLPESWTSALRVGSVLVAPVGPAHHQELVRLTRDQDGRLAMTRHGGVRYVPNRSLSS